uniref:Uncharacterized protein n=1 Tax=Oryza rufipogon TaxID=4529 RepID=A0A0E0PK78_ORYRU
MARTHGGVINRFLSTLTQINRLLFLLYLRTSRRPYPVSRRPAHTPITPLPSRFPPSPLPRRRQHLHLRHCRIDGSRRSSSSAKHQPRRTEPRPHPISRQATCVFPFPVARASPSMTEKDEVASSFAAEGGME